MIYRAIKIKSSHFPQINFDKSFEEKKLVQKTICARDGDRTHAHIRELDLKSNALTTRPPWRYVNSKSWD